MRSEPVPKREDEPDDPTTQQVAAWEALRRAGRVRRVVADEVVLREGEPSEGTCVLLAGHCAVLERGEQISSIRPGELFGEIAGLGGGRCTATVVALEAGEILVLTAEQLRRGFEQSPELLRHSLAAIAERMRRIAGREAAYREEHKALREVQLSLLPDLAALQRPGLRCEALWQPCSYASGDYYDVVLICPQRLLFAIGDVMGHGAEASLTMAIARAQLRELARGFRRTDELLLNLDGYLRDNAPPRQGMSLAVAVLDLRRNILEISSAGHPPPLLLREGHVRELEVSPGILLATPFLLGSGYTRVELPLRHGDWILFYTDGLFEVTSAAHGEGEPLGRSGLAALFAAAVRAHPEGPLAELARRVAAYDGADRAEDDRTALLVALP